MSIKDNGIKLSLYEWYARKEEISIQDAKKVITQFRKHIDFFKLVMEEYLIYYWGDRHKMIENEIKGRQKCFVGMYVNGNPVIAE